MDSKELGKFGESIACFYLEKKGYKIIDRNFKQGWSGKLIGEIDIVANKNNVISFVEVKSASEKDSGFFNPEDRANLKKLEKTAKIADIWLNKNNLPLDSKWQIDVLSVRINIDSKKAKIRYFKNCFA